MKRKFVAFLLIMAMCANGTTTVFAEEVMTSSSSDTKVPLVETSDRVTER